MTASLLHRREDFALIRKPLLALMVIVLVCGGLYAWARFFRDTQRQATQAAAAARQEAESLYLNALEEEKTIRSYLERYQQLLGDGIIGDEDRLEMIERLGWLREQYRLYPIEVEIAPQFSATTPGLDETRSGLILRASPIQLRLNLLHEGDLVHLLEGLQKVGGLLVAESCDIGRLNSGSVGGSAEATENLSATCRFFWVSLKGQGN